MSAEVHAIPKTGEIRYAYVEDAEDARRKHKYVGRHPYLIVSNDHGRL